MKSGLIAGLLITFVMAQPLAQAQTRPRGPSYNPPSRGEDRPSRPETPRTPSRPEEPRTPSRHEIPRTPSRPEEPRTPSRPEIPRTPTRPEVPRTPSRPEIPRTPSRPEEPRTPSRPEIPQTPPPSYEEPTPSYETPGTSYDDYTSDDDYYEDDYVDPDLYTYDLTFKKITRKRGGEVLKITAKEAFGFERIKFEVKKGALKYLFIKLILEDGEEVEIGPEDTEEIFETEGIFVAENLDGYTPVAIHIRAESMGAEANLSVEVQSYDEVKLKKNR